MTPAIKMPNAPWYRHTIMSFFRAQQDAFANPLTSSTKVGLGVDLFAC